MQGCGSKRAGTDQRKGLAQVQPNVNAVWLLFHQMSFLASLRAFRIPLFEMQASSSTHDNRQRPELSIRGNQELAPLIRIKS